MMIREASLAGRKTAKGADFHEELDENADSIDGDEVGYVDASTLASPGPRVFCLLLRLFLLLLLVPLLVLQLVVRPTYRSATRM